MHGLHPTRAVGSAAIAILGACSPDGFVCRDDSACGGDGQCEAPGFCSFPDDGCPSGRRYGEHAGATYANACVEPGADPGSSSTLAESTTVPGESSTSSSSGDASSSSGAGPTTTPVTVTASTDTDPDGSEVSSGGPNAIRLGPIVIADDLDDGGMWPASNGRMGAWHPSGEVQNGQCFMGEYPTGSAYYGYFRFALPEALPAGTQVTSARLEVTGFGTFQWSSDLDALVIRAQLSPDAPQVTGLGDYPELGVATSLTQTAVRWPAVGGLAWNADGSNVAPELLEVVQEVIDGSGGLAAGTHVQLWIGAAELGQSNREVGWRDASAGQGEFARLTLDVLVP
jgi:hypothetical protein